MAVFAPFAAYSTETLDMVPSAAFAVLSLWVLEKNYRWWISAVLLGISIGIRITSVLFMPIWAAGVYIKSPKRKLLNAAIYTALAILIGGTPYYFIFKKFGFTTNIGKYEFLRLGYYLYDVFGIWFWMAVAVVGIKYHKVLWEVVKKYWVYSLAVLAVLVFFVRYPYDRNYLVPAVPFLTILIAMTYHRARPAFILLLSGLVMNSFVSVGAKSLNLPAETYSFKPALKPGWLIQYYHLRHLQVDFAKSVIEWAKTTNGQKIAVIMPIKLYPCHP